MGRDKKVRGERHTLGSSPGSPMTTYQDRIHDYAGMERSAGDAALSAYAELYGGVERKLFAEAAAGRSATSLKSGYLKRYGIPARMFNGVRVSLEGKIASVREQQKLRADSLGRRIARALAQIADAVERGRWNVVHQKRRRLATLQSRLAALEADITQGRVRLCFGSKRLWLKQRRLEQNGYANHQEWLKDWQDARSDEFFVLGSRDETGGLPDCAWPPWLTTVLSPCASGCRIASPISTASTWSSRVCGSPTATSRCWRHWTATTSTPGTGVSMVRRRPGPPNWARPSATGSSGTPRAGGCSLLPR